MKRPEDQLFALVRAAMAGEAFEAVLTDDEWCWLYGAATRQSLLGVCFVNRTDMPKDVAMRWAADAETIRGLNILQYQEAARLTSLFAEQGRQSAILKGQANARLYPDKFSRQPGDIDIWVEGGRECVIELLQKTGLIESVGDIGEGKATASYHHVHLPVNEQGIVVEVHFRPSSGNFNPFTNRRLQRWLEKEIKKVDSVPVPGSERNGEFNVPTVRFALVMQLSHIQRHFLGGGIGLRHICDYYWLLRNSTAEDRQEVADVLKAFGLRHTAKALMWVLGEVLHLDKSLMICEPESLRGEWMLREILAGGNFGKYAERQHKGVFRRVIDGRLRHIRLMRFDFWELFWVELNFWKVVVKTIPLRIKYRTLSLRDVIQ